MIGWNAGWLEWFDPDITWLQEQNYGLGQSRCILLFQWLGLGIGRMVLSFESFAIGRRRRFG